jgi:anthranilate phosphoribosyltransferase
VSSKSGSADVLEAWACRMTCRPRQVAQLHAEETGIGFMFAPNHHPAMKNVAPVRRELGVRTIFNILGPLTNPADAPNILMGVFHPDLVGIQVRALQRLGAEHAVVVYGRDGMDEVSLGAATMVGELKDGADPRVRDPPRGLRPADGATARSRWRRRSSRWRMVPACWTTSPARRATSCCSTPAWRCTPPTWPTMADGIERAREAVARARRRWRMSHFVDHRNIGLAGVMSDILDRIVAVKREEVAAARGARCEA